jgi:hypothetical protein
MVRLYLFARQVSRSSASGVALSSFDGRRRKGHANLEPILHNHRTTSQRSSRPLRCLPCAPRKFRNRAVLHPRCRRRQSRVPSPVRLQIIHRQAVGKSDIRPHPKAELRARLQDCEEHSWLETEPYAGEGAEGYHFRPRGGAGILPPFACFGFALRRG